MKIVVFGGTGLIGSRLLTRLRERGHEAVAASPKSGVNAVTGDGLPGALKGAEVVVDVMNSPSFEDRAVLAFFESSTRNLLASGKAAGVRHHVALSVVGTERLQESGYFRAKLAQERLIAASEIPYTIARATQFFEFLDAIGQSGAEGDLVRLPPALMQPMSADDVAAALADYTVGKPANGIVEIAGPEPIGIDEAVRRSFLSNGDARRVVTDRNASYYGVKPEERSLTPGPGARLMTTRLNDWLAARRTTSGIGSR